MAKCYTETAYSLVIFLGGSMKIVAVKEKSAGNESVGDMWLETKIFEESTPIVEIIKWSQNGRTESRNGGRLIITVPDNENEI